MRLPARFLLVHGREPLPVRAVLRARRGLRLLAHRRAALPGAAVRAAAGPGRPAGGRGAVGRADLIGRGRGAAGESTAAVARPGPRGPGPGRRPATQDTPWRLNSEVPGHEMRTRWHVAPGALRAVERDMERGLLTARGLDRVLRVEWFLADLAGATAPLPNTSCWRSSAYRGEQGSAAVAGGA